MVKQVENTSCLLCYGWQLFEQVINFGKYLLFKISIFLKKQTLYGLDMTKVDIAHPWMQRTDVHVHIVDLDAIFIALLSHFTLYHGGKGLLSGFQWQCKHIQPGAVGRCTEK